MIVAVVWLVEGCSDGGTRGRLNLQTVLDFCSVGMGATFRIIISHVSIGRK